MTHKTNTIEVGRGVGPLSVGMPLDGLRAVVAAGALDDVASGDTIRWASDRVAIGDAMVIVFDTERVTGIRLYPPFEGLTEEGIGLGDPAALIEDAYDDLDFDMEVIVIPGAVVTEFWCTGTVFGLDQLQGLTIEMIAIRQADSS